MVQEFSKRASRLTVVENAPEPPGKLGPVGENLWKRVQSEYAIGDVGGVELLFQACQGVDRADELRCIIDQDGARIMGKDGPRAHPLLREETNLRQFIVNTLRKLGVTEEPLKAIGHPPNKYGPLAR
jgi:hypothetical protein